MDISFIADDIRFNYRVSCAILSDDGKKVLLHKQKRDPFWNLIGGRAIMNESSSDAIAREIREETGCECHIRRMLCIAENFFTLNCTKYHELLIIFSGSLTEEICPENIENGIEMQWFDIDQIDAIDIRPSFSRSIIQTAGTSQSIQWIINDETH